eukprot:SM000018S03647  [mRNA]  locus=s18:565566:569656:+ [translate_table: standard]
MMGHSLASGPGQQQDTPEPTFRWISQGSSCHAAHEDHSETMLVLSQGSFSDCLQLADGGLAMAGTATEQLAAQEQTRVFACQVGLGKPAFTIPGSGPQFTFSFAEAQARLLGSSVFFCQSPSEAACAISRVLSDERLLGQVASNGRLRMGPSGAARQIAEALWTAKRTKFATRRPQASPFHGSDLLNGHAQRLLQLLALVDLLAQRVPIQQALSGKGGVDDNNIIFVLESVAEVEVDRASEDDALGPGLLGHFDPLPHPLLRLFRVHLEVLELQVEPCKGDDSVSTSVFAKRFFHLELPLLDADNGETVANAAKPRKGRDDHTSADLSRPLEGVIEAEYGSSIIALIAGVVHQVKDGLSDGSFTGAVLEVGDVLPGKIKRDNMYLHMRRLHPGNHVGDGLVVLGGGYRVDP